VFEPIPIGKVPERSIGAA